MSHEEDLAFGNSHDQDLHTLIGQADLDAAVDDERQHEIQAMSAACVRLSEVHTYSSHCWSIRKKKNKKKKKTKHKKQTQHQQA
jgi:hypothetical protein